MDKNSHFHLHIHVGATEEAAKAAVEAYWNGAGRDDESVHPDESSPVTRQALAQRAYRESVGTMRPLLDFLAENPERTIPFGEASAALGFSTPRSMPGLLGAFGRRANHRYRGEWPFRRLRRDDAWYMRMDADIAAAIRSLREDRRKP